MAAATTTNSQLRELLAAYQATLDTIEGLPAVPLVLRRHGSRPHYAPRCRWLVRYFAVRHIERTLAALSRRYSARAAVGLASVIEQRERECVSEFQHSLPHMRTSVYVIALIAVTALVFRQTVNYVVPMAITIFQTSLTKVELRHQAKEVTEKITAALTGNFTSVSEVVNALAAGGAVHIAIVALGIGFSLYLVLRPLVPAFRLARFLFNVGPDPMCHSAVARWSVSRSTGIYEYERRIFSQLGGRAPAEFPFDIAVLALGMTLPLTSAAVYVRFGVEVPGAGEFAFATAGGLALAGVLRIGWLYRILRLRRSVRVRLVAPYEVALRGGQSVATVRSVVGFRAVVFVWLLVFITCALISNGDPAFPPLPIRQAVLQSYLVASLSFLILSVPWWYRVKHELLDLDKAYGVPRPKRRWFVRFWLLVLIVTAPLLMILAVYRLARATQLAQARAGIPHPLPLPWLCPIGLLALPALTAYLQRELNKVWKVEGQPLDPAGRLPWLRQRKVAVSAANSAVETRPASWRPLPEPGAAPVATVSRTSATQP